jgi:excisionase family DNA binding protein
MRPATERRIESGWLTRREAAERARVSVATVDRAIKRGQLLRAGRPGGLVRIRVEWVDDWLTRRGR